MPSPAEQQQSAQAGLITLLSDDLTKLWGLLDPKRFSATLPQLRQAVAALVQQYGAASASLAADFYDEERAAAEVTGRFTVVPADPAPIEQVEASIDWATRSLWTPEPNIEATQTLVTGAADKMVMDTGRATVLNAVHSDEKATGWARVTKPGACAFCRLLATRGAVYKSRKTASFQAHDHDRCVAEPLFGSSYEPTAHARADLALYRRVTRGKSGNAARIAFRQAVEGRTPTPGRTGD